MKKYRLIFTAIGLAKLANAQATQNKLDITHMAIGDANDEPYRPTGDETALVNEVWRTQAVVKIHEKNVNWLEVEAVIPAEIGGFTINEFGLYDADGDFVAISNHPSTPKPVLEEGSLMDLTISADIKSSNAALIELTADPTVITASKGYVDEKIVGISDSTDQKFDQVSTQLAQKVENTANSINVRDHGAKGDFDFATNKGTDDTLAFKAAQALAEMLRKKVYVPSGTYLLKNTHVIDDYASPGIYGDGKQQTILLFDLADGQTAIEANTHYFRQSEIRDLCIQCKNKNVANGLRIGPATTSSWTWGAACTLKNVDIIDFKGDMLTLDESFNCNAEGCRVVGVINTSDANDRHGKTLKISSTNSAYSNVNSFKNCVFFNAKIGIQNLNGTMMDFDSCTFENLSLWQHVNVSNRIAPYEIFRNCWYEKIYKGIINAEMDEETLTPITPISNKASLDNIIMQNNYQSGFVASPFIDGIVNADTNWTVGAGWTYGKALPFRSATLLNGWIGFLEYQKNDKGIVMIKLYLKPPSNIAVGSAGSTVGKIANIEAGFRPNSSCVIPVRDALGAIKHIFINNNGDVLVANDATFAATDNHTGQASYYWGA